MMPQRVGTVFLSYARSDRDLVQKIGHKLSEAGFGGLGIPTEIFFLARTGRMS